MKFTALEFYTEGLAVSNRDGSHYIEVFPLGVLGAKGGEISATVGSIKSEGIDGQGQKYQVTLEFTDSIPARWLPMDTQRLTPPDVRIGERVRLYRVADTDQFFWRTLGLDNNLRRLETVIYAFSATQEDTEELNVENSYFFEVSTHSKHITLSTSKANGEPFAYKIQLDTEEGIFTITDDAGNFFILNSRDTLLHLENKDGSLLRLDKRNGLLVIPDTYEIQCTDYKLSASKTITTETADHSHKSSNYSNKTNVYNLDASSSITEKSATVTITAPPIALNGNVAVSGGISGAGAGTFNSSVTIKGSVKASSGDFTTLTSMGKNVGGIHTHSGGGSGPPN